MVAAGTSPSSANVRELACSGGWRPRDRPNWPLHVSSNWPCPPARFERTVAPMSTTIRSSDRVDISRDARSLYRAYLALDRAVGESALDARIAELVRVRASQLNGCAYCVDMHTHDALAAGESA